MENTTTIDQKLFSIGLQFKEQKWETEGAERSNGKKGTGKDFLCCIQQTHCCKSMSLL